MLCSPAHHTVNWYKIPLILAFFWLAVIVPLLMRPLWCVFTCVRELIWVRLFTSVCVWVWHRVDFNNNALWLNCTGRKGMNSNVKCLLLSIMDGTDTAWWAKLEDFGTMWHNKRSNRKLRSASRKKRISLLPDGGTLKYSSVLGMGCKALCCWFPVLQDAEKHRHACHGNETASLRYT